MKRFISVFVICIMLSSVCSAESPADRFMAGLSDTWGAFRDMTEEAGRDAARLAEESGVTEWVEKKANDISAWVKENGLTDWAQGTLNNLKTWFDETGIREWATGTSKDIQAYIEENRPAIEAWLSEAGQSVRDAWDTLVNADQHTSEEVQDAYGIVVQSLEGAKN